MRKSWTEQRVWAAKQEENDKWIKGGSEKKNGWKEDVILDEETAY